jgi:hypothetical protein
MYAWVYLSISAAQRMLLARMQGLQVTNLSVANSAVAACVLAASWTPSSGVKKQD